MKNSSATIESQLLAVIRQFLTELGAERAKLAVTLDASLESDLGLGSLERAELFYRLEKEFQISLPNSLISELRLVKDFVIPIQNAGPKRQVLSHEYHAALAKAEVDLSDCQTLIEVLLKYAFNEPNRPHIYFQDDEGKEHPITYGQLFDNATAVSRGLVERGLKPTETVAIMLPTSPEFFYAFLGVLLAGGVPVPIYPPFRPDQIEDYTKREALILSNAEVRILITFAKAESLSKILSSFIPSLIEITTVDSLQKSQAALTNITVTADDAALIQYTSGSTGNPKGVLLTHRNLLANIRAYGTAINIRPTDIIVSWLPLYHDMGLIGTWFGSLYHGVPVVIMSPLTFLVRPERWLWTIHYHRATLSAGPNFAYELCVRKIDDAALEGLDLSCWRLAFNGAEAIYPKTLRSFIERFQPFGFKPETFFPVYGLAESSVALTFPPVGRPLKIDQIARDPFEKESKAIPISGTEKKFLEFVSCGNPLSDHEIRIVDDDNNVLPERRVGNLQFRGPSSMQGYYRNPEATADVYCDGWWISGDLAYIADGEVYITGRKKDVIIKAGRNLYPPEIEEIVGQIAGVRKGCVVAFGTTDMDRGTEKFIIVAETQQDQVENRQKIITNIIEKLATTIGMPPDEVVLVPPRTIPKTSSGKLRRSSAQQAYMQNTLRKRGMPAWLQMSKLFIEGAGKKIQRILPQVAKVLYTGYVSTLVILTLLPLWLACYLLPPIRVAKLLRGWARMMLRLAGCPLTISGSENLLVQKPLLFISNHTSYTDVAVLIAILPPGTAFVAKKELAKVPVLRTFIKKLNLLTVDRLDFSQSLADAYLIQETLQQGKSVFIFPEGTFTYATGLRPFKLGAFKLAVDTHIAICPIALQGTRYLLRSGSHLLRPSRIKVTISTPIMPTSKEWNEAIRLRDLARTEIAKHCGEPTLDLIRAGYEGS